VNTGPLTVQYIHINLITLEGYKTVGEKIFIPECKLFLFYQRQNQNIRSVLHSIRTSVEVTRLLSHICIITINKQNPRGKTDNMAASYVLLWEQSQSFTP